MNETFANDLLNSKFFIEQIINGINDVVLIVYLDNDSEGYNLVAVTAGCHKTDVGKYLIYGDKKVRWQYIPIDTIETIDETKIIYRREEIEGN